MIIVLAIQVGLVGGCFAILVMLTALALAERERLALRADLAAELALILERGLPLHTGLGILAAGAPFSRASVLGELMEEVESGRSLADALSAFPRHFPEDYRSLVAAGEAKGGLPRVLRHLARAEDGVVRFKHRLRVNLIYPGVLAVLLLALHLMLFPFFGMVQLGGGGAFDFPRELAGNGAEAALAGILCGTLAASIYGGWLRYWRPVRVPVERALAAAPGIGSYVRDDALARFAGGLAALLEAGVPLPEAWQTAAGAGLNPAIAGALGPVGDALEGGTSLADALDEAKGLPQGFRTRLQLGAAAGRPAQAAAELAEHLRASGEATLARLGAAIYPTFALAIGALVGLAHYALFGALSSVYKSVPLW